jgi:xanthine dehydrogenase molybdenum-binding subunit
MLCAKFLRSPHAHARIVRIDTAKAEELPGMKAVLTYNNVPKVHPGGKFEYLLDETVHYVGEEVAAVAAISEEIAEEALGLIEVEYDILPAVFTPEEAMKPSAPLVHPEHASNMFRGTEAQPVPRCTPQGWLILEVGNADEGFRESDYIIEGTYETQMQHPCSPMPRSVVAQWTGDKLICWADTQIVFTVWRTVAQCLGMPESKVQIVCPYAIGGYGAKQPEKTAVLAALLARRTCRPVKALFTREEDFVGTHRRLDFSSREKIGLKKDGTITALQSNMITNFGRDHFNWAFMIPACAAIGPCTMLYRWENSKWEGSMVMTNTPDHGAMNGFGSAEGGLCVERMIDEAAERIGMDPVEFRLKNCVRAGDKGLDFVKVITGPIAWGIVGDDIDSLQECIRQVAEKAEWRKRWKGWGTPVEVNGAKRRGIGIALGMHHSAYLRYSATLKMNLDGTANVFTQSAEIGQGAKTAMAQVVAETLGIAYEDVNITMADTAVSPRGFGNIGSGGTSSGITAAKYAAEDTKRKLLAIAAQRLGVEQDTLEAKSGRIYIKAQKEGGISIAEVCRLGYQITGSAVNPRARNIIDKKTGKMINAYAVAATIAEVEVDIETGALDVLRLISAHDCGRAINPTLVENQIDMSLTMGNGWVRTENMVFDRTTGVLLNPNLLDYKVMTFLDMPKVEDMKEILVEFPCAWGAYGAKGMSETAMTTAAPAIANAIYNAIGVRIRGASFTPEVILEALEK